MAVGGIVEAVIGVKAERTSLEDVARPLTLVRQASESLSGLWSAAFHEPGVTEPAT